jgi:hypothetical protein
MSCSICFSSPPNKESERFGGGYLVRRVERSVGMGASRVEDEVVCRDDRERLAMGGVEIVAGRFVAGAAGASAVSSAAVGAPLISDMTASLTGGFSSNIGISITSTPSFAGAGEPVRLPVFPGVPFAELAGVPTGEFNEMRCFLGGLTDHEDVIERLRDDPGSGRSMAWLAERDDEMYLPSKALRGVCDTKIMELSQNVTRGLHLMTSSSLSRTRTGTGTGTGDC